jgi:excinuclease ABC subunit B
MEREMLAAAEALEFERAAALRDQITRLQESLGKPLARSPVLPDPGTNRRQPRRVRGGGRIPRPKKP